MKKNVTAESSRPPTQGLVAKVAGVSQQSVSQALNGTGRLSAEKRKHILEVAAKLNYRPNSQALALRKNVYGSIGLIGLCNDPASYVPNLLLQNLQIGLRGINKHLTYVPIEQDAVGNLADNVTSFAIDGAFIGFYDENHRLLGEAFQDVGIPVIWLNNKHEYNCVYPDDYQGANGLTSFLLEQGYQDIVYVSHRPMPLAADVVLHYSVTDRYQGFRDAMTNAGLEPRSFTIDRVNTDLLRLLAGDGGQETFILCYEYTPAIRTLLTAKEAGLQVPGDLRIAYFHPQPHWENTVDAMMRCLPVPNTQLAEAAISMFEAKRQSKRPRVESVPVQYDPKFFDHLLTNEGYLHFDL